MLHVDTTETFKAQENVTLKRRWLQIQMFLELHQQDLDLEVPVQLPWLWFQSLKA